MLEYPTRFDKTRTGYDYLQKTATGAIHPGIDLNWGYGNQDQYQEVKNVTWGIVTCVSPKGYNGGAGNFIVIHHPHNGPAWVRHMHMDSIIVRKGDTVAPKQILGFVGRTGTTSSHDHFEVMNERGLEHIKDHWYPYGGYTSGLTVGEVASMWLSPLEWIENQDHYVGPNLPEILQKARAELLIADLQNEMETSHMRMLRRLIRRILKRDPELL